VVLGDNPITSRADIPNEETTGREECWLQRFIYKVWDFITPDKEEQVPENPPRGVSAESRNVEGVIDTPANHLMSPEYSPIHQAGNEGRLHAVKDSQRRDVRRFVYNEGGSLREVVLPNGSYVSQDGVSWNFKDRYGYVSPTTMEWLQVDSRGNVSFDNPSIGARVTLAVDEHTLINYWHRGNWQSRHLWSRVDKNGDDTISQVIDFEGKVLRGFTYEDGKLAKIANADRTSWSTGDGGKSWIFTEANGKQVNYPGLDVKVDQQGNVGYAIGTRKVVEFATGVNMVGPPPEWDRRWIDQFSLSSNLRVA
jgi:hypothetical protein